MELKKLSTDYMIQIGRRMVDIHSETETINDAIEQYQNQYPHVDEYALTVLWFGINCKDREHLATNKG